MKKLVVIFSLILTSIVSAAQNESPKINKNTWIWGTIFGVTNNPSAGIGGYVGIDISRFHIGISGKKIRGDGFELEDGTFDWSQHTGKLGFYEFNIGYNLSLAKWLTITPKIGFCGINELLQNHISYTYENLQTLPNAGIDIKLMMKIQEEDDKHEEYWLAFIGGIDANKNTTFGLGLYF